MTREERIEGFLEHLSVANGCRPQTRALIQQFPELGDFIVARQEEYEQFKADRQKHFSWWEQASTQFREMQDKVEALKAELRDLKGR